MRMKRGLQLIPGHEERAGIYHVVARTVWKTFLFNDAEKELLRVTMRNHKKGLSLNRKVLDSSKVSVMLIS